MFLFRMLWILLSVLGVHRGFVESVAMGDELAHAAMEPHTVSTSAIILTMVYGSSLSTSVPTGTITTGGSLVQATTSAPGFTLHCKLTLSCFLRSHKD